MRTAQTGSLVFLYNLFHKETFQINLYIISRGVISTQQLGKHIAVKIREEETLTLESPLNSPRAQPFVMLILQNTRY